MRPSYSYKKYIIGGLTLIAFLKVFYEFSKTEENVERLSIILFSFFSNTLFNLESLQKQNIQQHLSNKHHIYFEKYPDEEVEAKNFISNVYEGINRFYSVYNNTRLEQVEAFVFFEDHSVFERNINSLFLSELGTEKDLYFFETIQSKKKINCSIVGDGFMINPLHACYGWDDEWALAKTKFIIEHVYANNRTLALANPEVATQCITVRNQALIITDQFAKHLFPSSTHGKRFYVVGTHHFLPVRAHHKLIRAEAMQDSKAIQTSFEDIHSDDLQHEIRSYFSQNTRYAFFNLKSRVNWPSLLVRPRSLSPRQ